MADISAPNAAAYGIWGPAYAQALAAQSQGPVAGPLNMLAMRGYMGNEQGGYGEALAATRQAQLQAAQMEADAKVAAAAAGQLGSLNQYGGVPTFMPFLADAGINVDPAAATARTDLVTNDVAAGAFKDQTGGVANLADVGYLPPTDVISEQLFPVAAGEEAVPLEPYMTPDARNDQARAEAAMISAQAARTNANRPRGGGGGGNAETTEIKLVPNPITGAMEQVITIRKAAPATVERLTQGNAVEQTGGAESAQARLDRLRERR